MSVTKPIALDETLQAVNETLGEIRDNMVTGNSYAHKVVSGSEGNLTELTSDGDLADAGVSVDDIVAIAEGKTSTYVINISQNAGFNSQADAITVTGSLITTSGETVALSDIKKGDIILVTDTNIPDRWAANESSSSITFYKMETAKIDLTGYYTKTQTDSLLLDKADKVVGATSGHLAGLDSNGNLTDSAIPASDVTQIKQDLTQLTDEVGINLWDEEWELGLYNVHTGEKVSNNNYIRCVNPIKVIPQKNYYIWGNGNTVVFFFKENGNYISGQSITNNNFIPPEDAAYIKFDSRRQQTSYKHDICINRSNPAINGTYYPYRGLRKQITEVSNEALDIKMLGWSVPKECPIHNYMDGDRKFHQRVGRVDLGSLDLTMVSGDEGGYQFFPTTNIANLNTRNLYCIKYPYDNRNFGWSVMEDKTIHQHPTNTAIFRIRDDSYTTASAFKTAMQGVYLYYELATEIVTNVDGNEATLPQGVDDASGLNLTSNYGTISNVHMVRVGKLCTIICQMSITSAISAGGILLSGLPTAVVTTPAIVKDSAWNHKQAMLIGGGIRLNEALNSGTMYINTTYITE